MLLIIRMVAWAGLFLSISLGGLLFCGAIRESKSAPQEAAVGAIFATVFIGLYILTRCVDQFLEAAERVRKN